MRYLADSQRCLPKHPLVGKHAMTACGRYGIKDRRVYNVQHYPELSVKFLFLLPQQSAEGDLQNIIWIGEKK